MKKILLLFILFVAAKFASAQTYGGEIRAKNNPGVIDIIRRTADGLKTSDSALQGLISSRIPSGLTVSATKLLVDPGTVTITALTNSSIVKAQLQDNSGNAINSTSNALHVLLQNATLATTQSGNWTSRVVGNGGATLDATIGAATAPTNMLAVGGVYNSTKPTLTTGQSAAIQLDTKGNQLSVIRDAAGNDRGANVNASNQLSVSVDNSLTVTANAGTNLNTSALALETGGNLATTKTNTDNLNLTIGSTTSGQKGNLSLAAVTTSAPSYTTAQSHPLSLTTGGGLRIDLAGSAANSTAGLISTKIDQTTVGTTNAVSLAQLGTGTINTGNGTSGTGTLRVAIASDNTANTNPFLVTQSPTTTGGLTTYHLVSAASTNATNIKATAGQVYGYYIFNANAAARKVAFHNTSGTPTAGASVFFSLVIPAGSGANVFSSSGIAFSSGIGITTVTGTADNDATAVASGDLIINIFYK